MIVNAKLYNTTTKSTKKIIVVLSEHAHNHLNNFAIIHFIFLLQAREGTSSFQSSNYFTHSNGSSCLMNDRKSTITCITTTKYIFVECVYIKLKLKLMTRLMLHTHSHSNGALHRRRRRLHPNQPPIIIHSLKPPHYNRTELSPRFYTPRRTKVD